MKAQNKTHLYLLLFNSPLQDSQVMVAPITISVHVSRICMVVGMKHLTLLNVGLMSLAHFTQSIYRMVVHIEQVMVSLIGICI